MKKLAALCIAALGAALLVFGTTTPASAYPEQTCDVQVDHTVIKPGQRFTATGTFTGVDAQNHPINPATVQWTFTWNHITKQRTGSPVTASFRAPHVKKTRDIVLTGRARSALGDCIRHVNVTVVAPKTAAPHGNGSGLPNTGGPAFWVLVAGLVLLVGGGGTVVAARRRH
jgi:LPXTG-motif cell wall-anchored protein